MPDGATIKEKTEETEPGLSKRVKNSWTGRRNSNKDKHVNTGTPDFDKDMGTGAQGCEMEEWAERKGGTGTGITGQVGYLSSVSCSGLFT